MIYLVIFGFFSFSAENGISFSAFEITPYVNDFQTLNNSGSGEPVGAFKN